MGRLFFENQISPSLLLLLARFSRNTEQLWNEPAREEFQSDTNVETWRLTPKHVYASEILLLCKKVVFTFTNAFFLINASLNTKLYNNVLETIFSENSYSDKATLKAVMYIIHQQKKELREILTINVVRGKALMLISSVPKRIHT